MSDESTLRQYAPYPHELADIVSKLTYKPGWTFTLTDMARDTDGDPWDANSKPLAGGLTLDIVSCTYDSYHPERGNHYRVHHYRIVPAATYNRRSWLRWIMDEIVKIESHEAAEFLQVDGVRPFAPTHGPGNDPYYLVEYVDDTERRTSFRGIVKDG